MSRDYFWPPKFSEKKWTYEGTVNVHLQFMDGLPAPNDNDNDNEIFLFNIIINYRN